MKSKVLIASALIVSLSIGYYLVVFLPRQQVFRKEIDCREQYDKMRHEFSNVLGVSYSETLDTCWVSYTDGSGSQQGARIADFQSAPAPSVDYAALAEQARQEARRENPSPRLFFPATENVTESQIDGEFVGFSGHTIIKLKNRQVWQQASSGLDFTRASSPNVVIIKSPDGYQMQVEGVPTAVTVRRLE